MTRLVRVAVLGVSIAVCAAVNAGAVLAVGGAHGAGAASPTPAPVPAAAARVGMAAIDEPRPGSAMSWSTDGLGARSSAVVELPAGPLPPELPAAHADAVRRYGTG